MGQEKLRLNRISFAIKILEKYLKFWRLNGLISNYTVAQYKIHSNICNESNIPNIVYRDFDSRVKLEVAVSEVTNIISKIEFIYQKKFATLKELELQHAEYIYWCNYIRIHGSLGYMLLIEYRNEAASEMVE